MNERTSNIESIGRSKMSKHVRAINYPGIISFRMPLLAWRSVLGIEEDCSSKSKISLTSILSQRAVLVQFCQRVLFSPKDWVLDVYRIRSNFQAIYWSLQMYLSNIDLLGNQRNKLQLPWRTQISVVSAAVTVGRLLGVVRGMPVPDEILRRTEAVWKLLQIKFTNWVVKCD